MSSVPLERVMVVPASLLQELGYFQGFTANVDQYLDQLLDPSAISYRLRAEAERDPSLKQLIPYVIFRFEDPTGHTQVFQYTRGKGMGEQRLHAKRSVGIGGHIASIDAIGQGEPYLEGMRRELDEEVAINTPYQSRCVGLINDDQTPVGQVHLGVVYLFDVESPDVQPREPDIIDAGFEPVERLLANLAGFETWSSICLTALFGSSTAPSDPPR